MNVLDILNSPWAIDPETLSEMCSIYVAHRNGETRDIAAIQAAFGKAASNGPQNYTVQDGVATIPIEGILAKRMSMFQQICGGMSYTSFIQDLSTALDDPNVSSIVLPIDSPGGGVDGCEAASDAIYAARSQKPIVAWVDGKATSAAYWLGSSASKMYIGSNADQVGSIGVIAQHIDTSNLEHQRGVKVTDITAGRYKATGSQHAPLSAQDRNTIQDHLDQLYGDFVDTVARNRGTDAATVLSKMADGRVFVGQRAIDAGLVDGKMSLPQLMQQMKSQKGRTALGRAPQPDYKKGTTMRATQENITGPVVQSPTTPQSASFPSVAHEPAPVYVPLVRSAAQQKIDKLRVLKEEDTNLRRLLKDAQVTVRSKGYALWSGNQNRVGVEKLTTLAAENIRATEVVRSFQSRLRANGLEQLQVLHG